MATVLRAFGNALIWALAVAGVASGLVWGATRLGVIQPLVVVSGSMSPSIATGDLVVDRAIPTADLRPGEVASIRSAVTGKIVTHRVVTAGQRPDGSWAVTLKGDANDAPDAEVYVVGDRVWQPALQVAGAGAAVVTLTTPAVAIPLAVALLALAGLSFLSGAPHPGPADGRPEPQPADDDAKVAVA